MFTDKQVLLLDMNGTFMFSEDNFGDDEDYSIYYENIGGTEYADNINEIIQYIYDHLDVRYPDIEYRESFPTVESVIKTHPDYNISDKEIDRIVDTFAEHEIGKISSQYVNILHELSLHYTLGLVIDIWSPKQKWLNLFQQKGITSFVSAYSFSSDHGIVKPSPKPFNQIVTQLGVDKNRCLMIGDSERRDLGGAKAAGIDCVLVGGAEHEDAVASYKNLIALAKELMPVYESVS